MTTAHATQRDDEGAPTAARRPTSLGNYRLIARLGTGGMAEVFLAVAQGAMDVNRLVVVKRLRAEQAEEEQSREMFLNEARLAARLAHPNVIQTFEAGSDAGSYFLAMEYVDGQPLSRLLTALNRAGRPMDPKLAARICADALQGLHYAHELTDFDGSALQIVHRDVSPQNIMVTYDGVVKIVDFGIAKAAGTAQTEHGIFKGKVAFMAPEQLLGGQVDRRVDVFAAGIVLWEAVTGRRLMADDTPAKTLYNLMSKDIPRASTVCPGVPPALDAVLAKALERDVEDRYASAREMRDALEGFITSAGGVEAEQVGALVTGFFADTRAKIQCEVRAQLAALSLGRRSEPALRVSSQFSGTHIRTEGLIDLSEAMHGRSGSTLGGSSRVATSTGSSPPPSRAKRIVMGVWVAVTLGAVGASGLALVRSQRSSAPPAPAAATIMAPVAPAIAPPPPVDHAAAPAIETATVSVTTHGPTPTNSVVAAPAAPPAWRPAVVTRAAPAAPPAPVADAPRPQPAASAPPVVKPAETAAGRTFRRDL